jgi:aspartate 1-decarboxylase
VWSRPHEPSELGDIPVQSNMLIVKLRRTTFKQADLNYVGSVAIDRTLPQAGRLLPGERLEVVDDVTTGNRPTIYVIGGEAGVKQ